MKLLKEIQSILVIRLRVELTQSVVPLEILLRALVCLTLLDLHQTAAQNVLVTLNALVLWHAYDRNAKIHAQEHAATTLNVGSSAILQCASVCKDTKVIRSHSATFVNKSLHERTSNHAYRTHAVRMPFVANRMELAHVNVSQNISVTRTKDVVPSVF